MRDKVDGVLLLTDRTSELRPEAIEQRLQALQEEFADILPNRPLAPTAHTPPKVKQALRTMRNPWVKTLIATMLSNRWRDIRIEETLQELGLHVSHTSVAVHRSKFRKSRDEKEYAEHLRTTARNEFPSGERGDQLMQQLNMLARRITTFHAQKDDKIDPKPKPERNRKFRSDAPQDAISAIALSDPSQSIASAATIVDAPAEVVRHAEQAQKDAAAQTSTDEKIKQQEAPAKQELSAETPSPEPPATKPSTLRPAPKAETSELFADKTLQEFYSSLLKNDGFVARRILQSVQRQVGDVWTWDDIEGKTGISATSLVALVRELMQQRKIKSAREFSTWLKSELNRRNID